MSFVGTPHEPRPRGNPTVPGLTCTGVAELKQRSVSADDWLSSDNWLEEVVQAARSQTEALFTYFRFKSGDDLTVMIMSLKDYRLGLMFPLARTSSGPPMNIPEMEALGESVGGSELVADCGRQLVLRTTYLYYSVLHHILRVLFPLQVPTHTSTRFRARPIVDPSCNASLRFLLSIPAFHSSLLAVAATLVQAVACKDAAYLNSTPEAFLRHIHCAELEHNMLAVWNASRWFLDAFIPAADATVASPAPAPAAKSAMPLHPGRMVLGRLLRMSEERLIMADGSTLYHVINEGGNPLIAVAPMLMRDVVPVDTGRFTEGDQELLAKFLEAYARRAAFRAAYVAAYLVKQHRDSLAQKPQQRAASKSPPAGALDAFPMLASQLADRVAAVHLQLCLNQHMSVMVACCLYAVARSLHLNMPFDFIVNSFISILPDHTADLFYRQVELQPAIYADTATGLSSAATVAPAPVPVVTPAVMGSTRDFYNKVFLSTAEGDVRSLMQEHLKPNRFSTAAAAATTSNTPITSSTPAVRSGYSHPPPVGHEITPSRRGFSFPKSPHLPESIATPTPIASGPLSVPAARAATTATPIEVTNPVIPTSCNPSAGFYGNAARSRQGHNIAPDKTDEQAPALRLRSPAPSAVNGIMSGGGSKARLTPTKQTKVLRDLPKHSNIPATTFKGKATTSPLNGAAGLWNKPYYAGSPIMGVTGTQQGEGDKENGPWTAGAAGMRRKSAVWSYR